jgi:hypothetical protein
MMIHDLLGSLVSCVSMITPFAPSPGSKWVTKSDLGAWIIMRPDSDGTWKPRGRLKAWREPGYSKVVGYCFKVLPANADPVTIAGYTINSKHGGKFTIDLTFDVTPTSSPRGSAGSDSDLEVGEKHVTCKEDAALFVALAAAIDLSMDAYISIGPKNLWSTNTDNGQTDMILKGTR